LYPPSFLGNFFIFQRVLNANVQRVQVIQCLGLIGCV
jgi:hypothetical protein